MNGSTAAGPAPSPRFFDSPRPLETADLGVTRPRSRFEDPQPSLADQGKERPEPVRSGLRESLRRFFRNVVRAGDPDRHRSKRRKSATSSSKSSSKMDCFGATGHESDASHPHAPSHPSRHNSLASHTLSKSPTDAGVSALGSHSFFGAIFSRTLPKFAGRLILVLHAACLTFGLTCWTDIPGPMRSASATLRYRLRRRRLARFVIVRCQTRHLA